jgi:hypothetical protein
MALLRSGKSFSPALVHFLIRPTAWYVPKICGTSHGLGNNQENPYHKTRYALMRILPVLVNRPRNPDGSLSPASALFAFQARPFRISIINKCFAGAALSLLKPVHIQLFLHPGLNMPNRTAAGFWKSGQS